MSFAADVKKELTGLEVHREHAKAELAALLRMNGIFRDCESTIYLKRSNRKCSYRQTDLFSFKRSL